MKRGLLIAVFAIVMAGLLAGCGSYPRYPSLEACFSGPSKAKIGKTVVFNASCSYIPSGRNVSSRWLIDQKEKYSCQDKMECSHKFNQEGKHKVELILKDPCCNSDSFSKDITIVAPSPVNKAPEAIIKEPEKGDKFKVGEVINFNGCNSYDPDGHIVNYSWDWDFGDGLGSGKTTTHSYSKPGTYRVILTVTDNDGAQDEDYVFIEIEEECPPPCPEKNAILSLNRGEPIYCNPGEMATAYLIIDGWGNDVRTTVRYNPEMVQFNKSYPWGPWNLRKESHDPERGKIVLRFDTPITREERDQVMRVAEIDFLCFPLLEEDGTRLRLSNTEIYSEGQKVDLLAQIGTEIIIE